MKERPILFNGEMVRAILDGRKTQTRRIVKLPDWVKDKEYAIESLSNGAECVGLFKDGVPVKQHCRPFSVGDLLWVRETFALDKFVDPLAPSMVTQPKDGGKRGFTYFRADNFSPWEGRPLDGCMGRGKWRPSIHMPKGACRIWLKVKSVRVERLQDISEEDARAEGFASREEVESVWDGIYGSKGSGFSDNPWVWVVEFERVEP